MRRAQPAQRKRYILLEEYAFGGILVAMDLVQIYECLCDRTRLRILHLLLEGPLCVCHFQEVLGEPQVKISKHLAYLKTHGLVDVRREANWRVYSVAQKPTKALQANLACLQDCVAEDKVFQRDLERLKKLQNNLGPDVPKCCAKPQRLSNK